jgi:hypothetical protein
VHEKVSQGVFGLNVKKGTPGMQTRSVGVFGEVDRSMECPVYIPVVYLTVAVCQFSTSPANTLTTHIFRSYRIVHTLRLRYKNQSLNAVYINKR